MQNGATNNTKVGLNTSTFWIYTYSLCVNAAKTNLKLIHVVALVVYSLNVNYTVVVYVT